MYSVTQNISAAIHLGEIEPQLVIDRLDDRHKARLPELGVDTKHLLEEAKLARIRDAIFALLLLIPALWITSLLFEFHLIGEGEFTVVEYILQFIYPLLMVAAIGFIKTLVVNNHLRIKVVNLVENAHNIPLQNVVIFGGFSPFAGYGLDLDGWSFTIDSTKQKDVGSVLIPFSQIELLNHISKMLHKNIVQSTIDDKLFANGRYIRNNNIFLPNIKASPTSSAGSDVIEEKIGSFDQDARHYRVLSVPLANGEIFLTYFLRSTMLGDNLFIESRCFLLPPIKAELTQLVHLPEWSGLSYYSGVFLARLMASPVSWLAGPLHVFMLLGRIKTTISWALFGHPEDKLKVRDETYNYGNETSLRESWAAKSYQTYFQMLDKDMASKTCQHIIINSIVDFLEAKGIATDDIKERRTQIFNSGVIVSGGTVTAQTLAVGSGASVKSKVVSAFSFNKE